MTLSRAWECDTQIGRHPVIVGFSVTDVPASAISAFALQATPVAISTIVGSQAEDTMPTGGDGVSTHILAAQFGQDYTGRVEATALADDAIDWRSLTKTGNRPMSSSMEIGESIRGYMVEN